MKQSRLVWLVGVMGVLATLRVLAPSPAKDAVPTVAEAIVRKAPVPAKKSRVALPASVTVAALSPRVEDLDDPGNAFAVRPPPPLPYVPPVVVAKTKAALPAPTPVVGAVAAEPPPPPVPYQVIGTWDDGKEPGVFLSSPNGTLLARPGAMLQAEYKVISITPQQISLMHVASKREVRLAVTRPPNTPPAYP